MLKNLSPGMKISISRSIYTAFENYMNSIQWDEEKANIEHFVQEWREYIIHHASWYEKIDDEIKADPAFHSALATKINQTIDKILNEAPTEEQMSEIDTLHKEAEVEEYSYSCRAEARYVIDQLQKVIKKNEN
ncbi:hypothetical protein [Bacillus massiliigorillae]|uniref:hypothetical protein n=1 Tax=Bacillus massiliigorillae TaxID=1243664 RepID=UPI000399DB54|nr:hypothetical protein [Bacillus massiliigorillae]